MGIHPTQTTLGTAQPQVTKAPVTWENYRQAHLGTHNANFRDVSQRWTNQATRLTTSTPVVQPSVNGGSSHTVYSVFNEATKKWEVKLNDTVVKSFEHQATADKFIKSKGTDILRGVAPTGNIAAGEIFVNNSSTPVPFNPDKIPAEALKTAKLDASKSIPTPTPTPTPTPKPGILSKINWKKFGKWALIGAAVVGGVALIAGLVKNHKAKKEAAAEEALRQAEVQNQQQAAIDQLQKDVQAQQAINEEQQAQIEELQQQNQDLQDQIKAIPVVATTENDDATVAETENDDATVAETENDDTVAVTEDGNDDSKTSDVDKENLPHCADKMYTTKSGDNFWNLAKQNLKDKYGRVPTNTEILDETLRLMELNGYKLAEDGIHSDPMLYVDDELIIN